MSNTAQKIVLCLILILLLSLACAEDGDYVPPERLIPNDLSGANFSLGDLRLQDLSGKNLQNANFFGSNLYNANFAKANLQGANLSVAELEKANFIQADLRGVNLTEAQVEDANFTQADLRGANLIGACYLQTAVWTDAVLDEEVVYLINLLQTVESSKDLSEEDLDGVCFSQIDLQGANLQGASLRGANLFFADLTGADLTGADLTNATLRKATVTEEQLQSAKSICGIHFPDDAGGPLKQFMDAYGPDQCSSE